MFKKSKYTINRLLNGPGDIVVIGLTKSLLHILNRSSHLPGTSWGCRHVVHVDSLFYPILFWPHGCPLCLWSSYTAQKRHFQWWQPWLEPLVSLKWQEYRIVASRQCWGWAQRRRRRVDDVVSQIQERMSVQNKSVWLDGRHWARGLFLWFICRQVIIITVKDRLRRKEIERSWGDKEGTYTRTKSHRLLSHRAIQVLAHRDAMSAVQLSKKEEVELQVSRQASHQDHQW